MKDAHRTHLAPALLLTALLLVGMLGGWSLLYSASRDSDQQTLAQSRERVEALLGVERDRLGTLLADYAVWDDLYQQASQPRLDQKWLSTNLSGSIYRNFNVSIVLVYAPEQGIIYSLFNGRPPAGGAPPLTLSDLQWQSLTRTVDRYDPKGRDGYPSTMLRQSTVNPVTGQQETRLYRLAMLRIYPDSALPDPMAPRRYLLFGRELDAAQLKALGDNQGLGKLALNFSSVPHGLTRLPLRGLEGEIQAYLEWDMPLPGASLRQTLAVPMSLLLGSVLVLGVWLLQLADFRRQRGERSQQRRLQQGEALRYMVSARSDNTQQPDEFLQELPLTIASTLHVTRLTIWRQSPDGKELVCLAGIDMLTGQRFFGETLDVGTHTDYLDAVHKDRYLTSHDPLNDPRLHSLHDYLLSGGIAALLDASIDVGGLPQGVICAESRSPRLRWHQDEIEFLCAAADLIGLIMESAARLKAEGELYRQFYYDRFTGLPNRARLLMQMNELTTQGESLSRPPRPFGCFMMALEGLANVNELYGRENGDQLIRNLVSRLEHFTSVGEMVARTAENRFCVLVFGENDEAIVKRVDKLDTLIARTVDVGAGQTLLLRLNSGLALYPGDSNNPERLLEHAELALQISRNTPAVGWVRFHEGMSSDWRRRHRLQSDLSHATTLHQLLLHYQPYTAAGSGHVAGAEALLRWQHPELGLVPPSDFIPLAEETGLIVELGEWALQEAIDQTARWREILAHDFVISVNVSLLQLEHEHFADTVARLLATRHLPGSALELEVTEGLALRNTPTIDHNLQRLRALGVRIAIDDFGTGYASFSFLRRFPVEKLKIDRHFLEHVPDNVQDSNLVKMIIAVGHALGAHVTGEGIEDTRQAAYLAEHGCDYLQGYLISRPLNAEDMESFLAVDRSRARG